MAGRVTTCAHLGIGHRLIMGAQDETPGGDYALQTALFVHNIAIDDTSRWWVLAEPVESLADLLGNVELRKIPVHALGDRIIPVRLGKCSSLP